MILLTARTEMNERQLEIFRFCEQYFFAHENPLYVSKYAHYFSEGYDAFGLDEEELKKLRDDVLERFDPTVPELAELAVHFFATGKYEFGSLAILLLKKHRPRFDRSVYEGVKRCADNGVENWAHADLIAGKITPVFIELGIAGMDDFREWIASPSKWTRRIAAVTMLYQRNRVTAPELLEFVQPLMKDPERAVQQGAGWFLRELWKISPREVEDYLFLHKDTAPRLIIQYATEKMNKDRKKRFRKAIGHDPDKPRPKQVNKPQNKPQAKQQGNQQGGQHPKNDKFRRNDQRKKPRPKPRPQFPGLPKEEPGE